MKSELLDFGTLLLDQTRRFVLEKIADGFEKKLKPDASFVTTVDTGVEEIMRKHIIKAFPSHGIVGEEGGVLREDAEYVWYLDPIDGTAEFVKGLPQYGTLLSLYRNGRPVLGMIDHPSLDLRLHAEADEGAFINDTRIWIRDQAENLSEEKIAIGPRFMFEKQNAVAVYDKLIVAFPGADEIQNCHWHTRLLQGEFGAVVDYGLRSWDISPVQVLVEESGGKFVEMESKLIDGKDRHAIIFGKPSVVNLIVDSLERRDS
jgi:fructose-1,6-bisphosphatase/inositol monophosphatase family enzyme